MHYQGSWKILEKCVEWQLLLNVTAPLPCGEVDCITILSSGDEDPALFGVQVEGEVESYSGVQEDPPENAAADAAAGASDDFPMGHEPEEFAPVPPAPPSDAFEPPPERPRVQDQQVIVDGIALTPLSTLGALRAACEKLGLSKSGSKQRCYDRLKGYVEKQKLSAEVEVAQHGASASSRDPNLQPVPQPPSREAQLLHECTHLPYAPWCKHCVMMKAVPDRHTTVEGGSRAYPTISFDLYSL